jgi:hypothetical protein
MEKTLSYRSWFFAFLMATMGLLACVALFNFLVDSQGAFGRGHGLGKAARYLLNNSLIAGEFGRLEERELQRLIIRDYPRKRDIIALGSSRSFLIRKRFISGEKDFFNHSVTAAGIPDYITIIGMYRERGHLPRAVMFSVDPWVFNRNNGAGDWWQPLARYYDIVTGEMYGKDSRTNTVQISKYLELINLEYTTTNCRHLRKGSKLMPVKTTDINDFVREPDGSLHLPYSMRFAKAENTIKSPANATTFRFFQNFDYLSHTGLFEDLIRYLKKNRVSVVLVLLPINPSLYEQLKKSPEGQFILSVEDYLKGVASKHEIQLIGSYDPKLYGLTGKDFFDSIHGHDAVAQKIMAEYR